MTVARRRTGRVGEELAASLLARHGYRLIARNCRTRAGEIDIVALDGRTLAFVEVKTMRTGARAGPERPVLAVGPRKQLQVRRLARAWLAENRPAAPRRRCASTWSACCLDPGDRPVSVEHIQNAF